MIHAPSRRNNESRFVSTAEINNKLYTVVWTWRDTNQRIISFRRARDVEERTYRKRSAGETHSDWARAAAATSEEIEAQVAADPDEAGMVVDWESAAIELPKAKADLHMRVDRDLLDYFRSTGKGYQTRINAVLRSYVNRMRRDESPTQ